MKKIPNANYIHGATVISSWILNSLVLVGVLPLKADDMNIILRRGFERYFPHHILSQSCYWRLVVAAGSCAALARLPLAIAMNKVGRRHLNWIRGLTCISRHDFGRRYISY